MKGTREWEMKTNEYEMGRGRDVGIFGMIRRGSGNGMVRVKDMLKSGGYFGV